MAAPTPKGQGVGLRGRSIRVSRSIELWAFIMHGLQDEAFASRVQALSSKKDNQHPKSSMVLFGDSYLESYKGNPQKELLWSLWVATLNPRKHQRN